MPTVTVQESVSLEQAATALHDKLGSDYEITTHGSGAHEALKVKQSAASTATVQDSSRRDRRSLRREIVMAVIACRPAPAQGPAPTPMRERDLCQSSW